MVVFYTGYPFFFVLCNVAKGVVHKICTGGVAIIETVGATVFLLPKNPVTNFVTQGLVGIHFFRFNAVKIKQTGICLSVFLN